MSPSGPEFIRRIKAGIDEIDPAAVHELVGNGVAIVDVREADEWAQGHLPGAKHVPRGFLESRIEGVVPDRGLRVILYCASGNRSALAAHTLAAELGYERVESMTGGITLWKDRGYEVVVPRTFTPEQRERYSRHVLIPEIGESGQQKLLDAKVLLLGAGGLGSPTALYLAAAGVGTLGIVEPPAPGDPQHGAHRRVEGRVGRGDDPRAQPRREGDPIQDAPRRLEHHGDHLRLRHRR
jgi:rhodanese-related sulfurtransferase